MNINYLLFSNRLAHHEALHSRRTQINGSDSSEDQDDFDDNEWGSATEL